MVNPLSCLTALLIVLLAAPVSAQQTAATSADPAPTTGAKVEAPVAATSAPAAQATPAATATAPAAATPAASTPAAVADEAVAAPAEAASTAAPTEDASTAAPTEDAAWDAFLATLPDDASGSARSDSALTAKDSRSVGMSTTDLGRAGGVVLVAFFALAILLAVPATRRRILAKLTQRPVGPAGLAIDLKGSKSLGAGQRIVAVEVDGVRILVGVSQGRMDVLHSWWLGSTDIQTPSPIAEATAAPAPTAAPEAVSVVQQVLAERNARAAAPTPRDLVGAWTRSQPAADAPAAPAPPVAEQTPWWMEGATADEAAKFTATAAEAKATEDVLRRVRARRAKAAPAKPAAKPAATKKPAPAREELKATGTDGLRTGARFVLLLALGVLLPALAGFDLAEAADPAMRFEIGGSEAGASPAIKLLTTLTLLAVAPALVLAMTSFTRLIVVFSLLRQAVGVQQAPPNQVLIGLALFLTWFIMGPTFTQVQDKALGPWMDGQMTEGQALDAAMVPMRGFMFKNTREQDLALFLRLDKSPRPATRADVPARVLVPAFLISELKTAFTIGFLLYIPFLVIDIVVSTVLLAMGMMVLPPVVISLPFKLLLFVFVDGWNLLVGSLVTSFA